MRGVPALAHRWPVHDRESTGPAGNQRALTTRLPYNARVAAGGDKILQVGIRTLGLFTISVCAVAGCNGEAAERRITPDTLQEALLTAKGGEKFVLVSGQYGDITFPPRTFRPQITIDAAQAQFTGIVMRKVEGVAIEGGNVTGPRERMFAVLVDFSRNVAFRGMKISGSRIGISVSRSQGIAIERNRFDGVRSDGVNIAGSQRVNVIGNTCTNFDPILPVYDPAGKLMQDGDHPDCIQGWSIVGMPPTADVTVIGNSGRGFMQGVWFGNPGQGGYDRIIVRQNNFELAAFNAIVVLDARDSEISDNSVRNVPGARMLNYPFKPYVAWIRATGSRNVVCGNRIEQPRFSLDSGRCGSRIKVPAVPVAIPVTSPSTDPADR